MYTKNIALLSRTTSLLKKWAKCFESFEEINEIDIQTWINVHGYWLSMHSKLGYGRNSSKIRK